MADVEVDGGALVVTSSGIRAVVSRVSGEVEVCVDDTGADCDGAGGWEDRLLIVSMVRGVPLGRAMTRVLTFLVTNLWEGDSHKSDTSGDSVKYRISPALKDAGTTITGIYITIYLTHSLRD